MAIRSLIADFLFSTVARQQVKYMHLKLNYMCRIQTFQTQVAYIAIVTIIYTEKYKYSLNLSFRV